MKMTATRGGQSMVIQSSEPGKRPEISGDLWDAFKPSSVEEWLTILGVEPMNAWPEIDFALAITKDPGFETEWIEPIFGLPPDGVVY